MKKSDSDIKKIRDLWEEAEKKGLTFGGSDSKKRLSKNSYDKYRRETEAYNNWLEHTYGHGITKSTNQKAKAYLTHLEQSGKSAWRLKAVVHSLANFREATKQTSVFPYQVKTGSKTEMLADFKTRKVIRKIQDSSRLKPAQEELSQVIENIKNSRSPEAANYYRVARLQSELGCRVSEALTIKVSDVELKDDGTALVRIKGKGGLVRHVPVQEAGTIAFLKDLSLSKKPSTPLVPIKNKDGKNKSLTESKKQYESLVARAAREVNETHASSGKRFTTHSMRAGYAQSQVNMYANWSTSQLKREIARRIEWDNQLDAKERANLKRKLDATESAVRKKLGSHIEDPKMRLEYQKNRELNHKELALWLTSVDLGHGRLDILLYYLVYPDGKKK